MSRDLDPAALRAMTLRYVIGMLFYVGAFALAFVSVALSLAIIVVLALLFVLPEPSSTRTVERRRHTEEQATEEQE